MAKYGELLEKYLEKSLPNWVPRAVIERTVEAYDVGDNLTRADYETAPLVAKGLEEYIRNQYNPTQARGSRISDPERMAKGGWATNMGDGQGMHLLDRIREDLAGSRFNQNVSKYWPSNANVQYNAVADRKGYAGFVESSEPNVANLAFGNFPPDTVAHELEHARPSYLRSKVPVTNRAAIGYEGVWFSEDENDKERQQLVNYSVLDGFVRDGKLPSNALSSSQELMAALVGRESTVKDGKSLSEDEVLGYVLAEPSLRDWYLANRFRD